MDSEPIKICFAAKDVDGTSGKSEVPGEPRLADTAGEKQRRMNEQRQMQNTHFIGSRRAGTQVSCRATQSLHTKILGSQPHTWAEGKVKKWVKKKSQTLKHF